MTQRIAPALLATLALAGCGGAEATADTPADTPADTAASASTPEAPMTRAAAATDDGLAADLISLREEEKLARDVYLTLLDRWGLPMFEQIAGSEQRHMDRVGELLAARGLEDPVVDPARGAFTSPRFSELYTSLVERGERSERAALEVGALIEELDLADIEGMAARTEDPDVSRTYALLACGSRNHLRAFTSRLAADGASYTPIHLSAEAYQAVLDGEHERCGRIYGGGGGGHGGGGHGGGRGHGGSGGGGRGHGGGGGGGPRWAR